MTRNFKLTAAAAMLAAAAGAFASQDDARADNAWIAHDVATQPGATLLLVNDHPVLTRDPIAFFAAETAPVPMAAADDSVIYVIPGVTTDTVYLYSEPVYYFHTSGTLVDNGASVTP